MLNCASGSCRTRWQLPAAHAGFTLIELIVVMVMITVLGAMAIPRFVGPNAFDTFGFSEQTGAMLRFAQKAAIAQRRTFCVGLSGSNVVMTRAAAADVYTCSTSIINPADGKNWQRPLPNGVSVAGLATPIRFNALGQPVDSSGSVLGSNQSIVISGEFSRTLLVEAETGYVH